MSRSTIFVEGIGSSLSRFSCQPTAGSRYGPATSICDIRAITRATTRVAPTNPSTAHRGQDALGPKDLSPRPPRRGGGLAIRQLSARRVESMSFTDVNASAWAVIKVAENQIQKRPCGLSGGEWRVTFRAYPATTGAPCVRLGTQGTDAFIRRLGDSRKNRPRAERRGSFWSFFLRE